MSTTNGASGQVLPVLLAMIAMGLSALFVAHRVSNALGQQSVVVNAADAAAYSGAHWTARRLNLMAYTNRAMLANHIAVGHLVAYISWLRYVENASARLAAVSSFIPYVGTATRVANRAVRTSLGLSERLSWGFINGVDVLHGLMSASQLQARRQLLPDRIDTLMRKVAQRHDGELRVNRGGAIQSVPQPYQAALAGKLLVYRTDLLNYVDSDQPGRDRGYFQRILSQSIDDDHNLSRWLRGRRSHGAPRFGTGGRSWSDSILGLVKLRKQGATNQAPSPDAGGWRSADRFQIRERDFLGWESWGTLAQGRANADRLAGNYDGIDRYTHLAQRNNTDGRLEIPAIVTRSATNPPATHAHYSVAEVVYQPSKACKDNCPPDNAKPTLFNPYWRARLVAPEILP